MQVAICLAANGKQHPHAEHYLAGNAAQRASAPCHSTGQHGPWGSHPRRFCSCTGSNSDLSRTSTHQACHQSTHIFRPDYLQSQQSSAAFPRERLSSRHRAFFPQWNYIFTFLLNFSAVARGQIFHQITLAILFTNPCWGQIPGKVTQLFSHAVCSLSKSGRFTTCWHNVPALLVFVAEETWGELGGLLLFCKINRKQPLWLQKKKQNA